MGVGAGGDVPRANGGKPLTANSATTAKTAIMSLMMGYLLPARRIGELETENGEELFIYRRRSKRRFT